MKPGIIVTARTGSTRFPGKHLKPFRGTTVLGSVRDRCEATGLPVVLAVPHGQRELAEQWCRGGERPVFYGSEANVLARVCGAAVAHGIDPVIRVTGDCPLAEPAIILEALEVYRREVYEPRRTHTLRPGAASNVFPSLAFAKNVFPSCTFAKGLDVEVVPIQLLLEVAEAPTPDEAEHVTLGVYRRWPERVRPLRNDGTWPGPDSEPLCIDTPEDLARLDRADDDEDADDTGEEE